MRCLAPLPRPKPALQLRVQKLPILPAPVRNGGLKLNPSSRSASGSGYFRYLCHSFQSQRRPFILSVPLLTCRRHGGTSSHGSLCSPSNCGLGSFLSRQSLGCHGWCGFCLTYYSSLGYNPYCTACYHASNLCGYIERRACIRTSACHSRSLV